MDRTLVSEAEDVGSIPAGSTRLELVETLPRRFCYSLKCDDFQVAAADLIPFQFQDRSF